MLQVAKDVPQKAGLDNAWVFVVADQLRQVLVRVASQQAAFDSLLSQIAEAALSA